MSRDGLDAWIGGSMFFLALAVTVYGAALMLMALFF